MTIIALDFETANPKRSSACALGLVVFDHNRIRYEWSTLINPEQEFSGINIGIHGIRPDDVANAPTVKRLVRELWPVMDGATFASHSSFDVGVVNAISQTAGVRPPNSFWLDSCEIARNLWTNLPNHKLNTVCAHLKFEFRHHDALDDARACCHILRTAMEFMSNDSIQLRKRFGRPSRH